MSSILNHSQVGAKPMDQVCVGQRNATELNGCQSSAMGNGTGDVPIADLIAITAVQRSGGD